MGGDAMFRAMKRSKTRAASFVTLLALASFADEDGLCYPSVRAIAERARLSRRQVIRALDSLEAAGEVKRVVRGHTDRDHVKDRRRRGGFQCNNYYQLLLINPIDRLSDVPESKVVTLCHHPGSDTVAYQAVKNQQLAARRSLFPEQVTGNESGRRARGAGVISDQELVNLMASATRDRLQKDPTLGGQSLLEAVLDWAARRGVKVSADMVAAGIELALVGPAASRREQKDSVAS